MIDRAHLESVLGSNINILSYFEVDKVGDKIDFEKVMREK